MLKSAVTGAVAAVVMFGGVPTTEAAAPLPPRDVVVLPSAKAPASAAGFQAMFDKVSTHEWGGGDVSTSVRLVDGRSVWLYGDTLSRKHGMVNSTALTQTGSTLHVSHGGAQLLPKGWNAGDGRKIVYWIETARHAGGNKVDVTVAPMSIGSGNVWDFRRATDKSRVAHLAVARNGDVNFTGWGGWVPEPYVDKTLLGIWQGVPEHLAADPGAVFYRKNAHPQFRMASGKVLKSICRNRTDGDLSDLKKFRPIFIEEWS